MKKVLIISYMFPPVGGGGVVRMTKFAKYLPQFGWMPRVVTVKKALYHIEDQSLLAEIPTLTKVSRVGYFDPALWSKNPYWQAIFTYILYPIFLIPDARILWFLPGLIRAYKIVKKENIKIVFTSSSSYSDHLIALFLKKLTKVKWVADFRDEWSNNLGIRFPTKLHLILAQFLERKVVQNADHIIGVSKPIISFLRDLSKEKSKFTTLNNGFDPTDFKEKVYRKRAKCHFLHAGAIYGQRKNNQLESAISELKNKNISFDFLGGKKRLPHSEAVKAIATADVLVLILSPVYYPGVFSGKLFEYLAARRPILALVPEKSEAAKLIRKLNAGIVVDPGDKEAIKKAILTFYQKWQKNSLSLPQSDISGFNRQKITEKLAQIFDQKTEIKNKIKLCLIGDLKSIHNIRFVNFFKSKLDIHFISSSKQKVNGIKTYYLAGRTGFLGWTPLYFIHSVLMIRRIIRRIKPDIVHGQNIVPNGAWAYASGFRPFILTAWGSDILLLDRRPKIERRLVIRALKKATAIIYDSNALGRSIKKFSKREKGLYEIQFGVDTNKFRPKCPDLRYKKRLGLDASDKVIFCPRGLTKLYNTDKLILAYALLVKENPHLKLVLIKFNADPVYLSNLLNLINELKISKNVILLESVSPEEMAKLYQIADLMVSIPTSDSSPVSVLEAMATGSKIVLSNLPYVKEWFSPHKDNFFVADNSDTKALAGLMTKALKEKNFTRKQKFNRELIISKADQGKNLELMHEIYKEIV